MTRKGMLFWLFFAVMFVGTFKWYLGTCYGPRDEAIGFSLAVFVLLTTSAAMLWVLCGYVFHKYTHAGIVVGGLVLSIILGGSAAAFNYLLPVTFFLVPIFMAVDGLDGRLANLARGV